DSLAGTLSFARRRGGASIPMCGLGGQRLRGAEAERKSALFAGFSPSPQTGPHLWRSRVTAAPIRGRAAACRPRALWTTGRRTARLYWLFRLASLSLSRDFSL